MKLKLALTILLCLTFVFCFISCGDNGAENNGSTQSENTGNTNTNGVTTYTVTFVTNCDTHIEPATVESGKKVMEPEQISRAGYTFLGWYYGTEKWTFAGYTVTDNMTLEAKWRANENYLSFERNGAPYEPISGTSVPMKTGETKNLMTNPYHWENHEFLGWSTTPNGPVEYLDGAPYTMGTESTKLYAVWANVVVFDGNGATEGTMENLPIMGGGSANLTTNSFKRAGYIFKGWSTTKDGSVEYTDGAEYTMGDEYQILYAVWEVATYTITYECNGGATNTLNPVTFTVNDLPIELKDLGDQPSSLFNGWYFESDFSGSPVFEITEAKDITLYAEFIEGTSGLKFEERSSGMFVSQFNRSTANELIIPNEYKGKKVVGILESAIYNCPKVKTVKIPKNLQYIDPWGLYGCTGVVSFEVDTENEYFTAVDGSLYTKDGKTLVRYASGKSDTSYTVPSVTTEIIDYAFFGSKNLVSVIIPNSVNVVGMLVFAECPNLKIYCEADEFETYSWHDDWNFDERPVEWEYVAE